MKLHQNGHAQALATSMLERDRSAAARHVAEQQLEAKPIRATHSATGLTWDDRSLELATAPQ